MSARLASIWRRLGFAGCRSRPQHPKTDPDAQEAFKKNFRAAVEVAIPETARGRALELWFQE